MGGNSDVLENDDFVELINGIFKWSEVWKREGLFLDGVTFFVRDEKGTLGKKGEYVYFGTFGIELSVGRMFKKRYKLTKRYGAYVHAHS